MAGLRLPVPFCCTDGPHRPGWLPRCCWVCRSCAAATLCCRKSRPLHHAGIRAPARPGQHTPTWVCWRRLLLGRRLPLRHRLPLHHQLLLSHRCWPAPRRLPRQCQRRRWAGQSPLPCLLQPQSRSRPACCGLLRQRGRQSGNRVSASARARQSRSMRRKRSVARSSSTTAIFAVQRRQLVHANRGAAAHRLGQRRRRPVR